MATAKYSYGSDRSVPADRRNSIRLAFFLTLAGLILIMVGILMYMNIIITKPGGPNEGHIMTGLGCLMFLPGSYHSVIAYKTWRGERGYSYDQIPAM
jgi:hypothetical protein